MGHWDAVTTNAALYQNRTIDMTPYLITLLYKEPGYVKGYFETFLLIVIFVDCHVKKVLQNLGLNIKVFNKGSVAKGTFT